MLTTHTVARRILLLLAMAVPMAALGLEEPAFDIVASTDSYEIRRYPPYNVAEVDIPAKSEQAAGRPAFRALAGYIFGDNDGKQRMSMTVPVESRPTDGAAYTYTFVMERQYDLAALPRPDDDRIRLITRPGKYRAALRYSGGWTARNDRKHRQALLAALRADGVKVIGPASLARYNAPFVPGFMRRNEVLVDVDWAVGAADSP